MLIGDPPGPLPSMIPSTDSTTLKLVPSGHAIAETRRTARSARSTPSVATRIRMLISYRATAGPKRVVLEDRDRYVVSSLTGIW